MSHLHFLCYIYLFKDSTSTLGRMTLRNAYVRVVSCDFDILMLQFEFYAFVDFQEQILSCN